MQRNVRAATIPDILEEGEVSTPLDGVDEPRSGGTRDYVLPANKEFVEGDILPRPSSGMPWDSR